MAIVPAPRILSAIQIVRGYRVLLASDLAVLYGVPTKRLNEQVKRNRARFPADFMFRLTSTEAAGLRSQIATSNVTRGGRRVPPFAFTEHGAVMLASVLNSRVAVATSIQVVRAFNELRRTMLTTAELTRRLDELEKRYDGQFHAVFNAIRQLMPPAVLPIKRVGFKTEGRSAMARRTRVT